MTPSPRLCRWYVEPLAFIRPCDRSGSQPLEPRPEVGRPIEERRGRTLTRWRVSLSPITLGRIGLSPITLGRISLTTITLGRISLTTITLGRISLTTITGRRVDWCHIARRHRHPWQPRRKPHNRRNRLCRSPRLRSADRSNLDRNTQRRRGGSSVDPNNFGRSRPWRRCFGSHPRRRRWDRTLRRLHVDLNNSGRKRRVRASAPTRGGAVRTVAAPRCS